MKNDIDVKMPVSESQASYSGMAGIYREAKYADFIDMHAYWQHPRWLGRAWDRNNWEILFLNAYLKEDAHALEALRTGESMQGGNGDRQLFEYQRVN